MKNGWQAKHLTKNLLTYALRYGIILVERQQLFKEGNYMTVREFVHNYINRNVLISDPCLPIEVYGNEIEQDSKIERVSSYCDLYRVKTDDDKSHLFLIYKAKGEVRMNVDSAHFTFGVGTFSFHYGKYFICDAKDEDDCIYREYMELRDSHRLKMRAVSDSIPKDIFKGYTMSVALH